ncbi:hypothetical protein T4D_8050 [Trichinella pseudospiralis]|uniref:Uncharacterized protein n=1 Tax=Trichinella pseudospiralis TaxID=6337 RepID=A0A0V1FTJ8_TRIPS|nr:hypothetical protein T4D_8050 [Trichinella pseudospiralis]
MKKYINKRRIDLVCKGKFVFQFAEKRKKNWGGRLQIYDQVSFVNSNTDCKGAHDFKVGQSYTKSNDAYDNAIHSDIFWPFFTSIAAGVEQLNSGENLQPVFSITRRKLRGQRTGFAFLDQ